MCGRDSDGDQKMFNMIKNPRLRVSIIPHLFCVGASRLVGFGLFLKEAVRLHGTQKWQTRRSQKHLRGSGLVGLDEFSWFLVQIDDTEGQKIKQVWRCFQSGEDAVSRILDHVKR